MTTSIIAPAKINLALDVVGKKDNGYHLLEMIMQTISLHDEITITPSKHTSLICNKTDVPTDENNICIKAWQLIKDKFKIDNNIEIKIDKDIPVAGGLAGGSTDGAAVILAANKEFDLKMSLPQMKELGLKLGTDVPFCLQKGTALATGIGDKLLELPTCPKTYVLAVNAGFPVSTVQVYKNLVWHQIKNHPNITNVIKAIKNQDINSILSNTGNVLECSAFQLFPQLQTIKQKIGNLGVFPIMSGSGGTMLGLTPDIDKARYALKQVQEDFPFAGIFETE
jgi:4-diphosphocytidyl-2-C-methyl-D-erythritol kinase